MKIVLFRMQWVTSGDIWVDFGGYTCSNSPCSDQPKPASPACCTGSLLVTSSTGKHQRDDSVRLYLVGGLERFYVSIQLGIIIPTDFHIFRGVETTNQIYNYLILFMFLGWLKATNQNFIIYIDINEIKHHIDCLAMDIQNDHILHSAIQAAQ